MNFLIILLSVLSLVRHDFHVSITHVEHNEEARALQISMKVFTDDLENALQDAYEAMPRLGGSEEHPEADSLIYDYITRHFWLKAGDQRLKMNWVGKELEGDILFIYLEVTAVSAVNALSVSNTVFFDRFEDQSNIVNIEMRGKLRSAFLEKKHPVKTLTFD